ncbi:hypothetical protein [Microbacterium enclense]|uniref:hypothetical protein n=1 Tax=Microbacterium enclense TaxID=993073 RepID=UPI003F7EC4E3
MSAHAEPPCFQLLPSLVMRTIMDLLDGIPMPLTRDERTAIFESIEDPCAETYRRAAGIVLAPGTNRRDPRTLAHVVSLNPDTDTENPGQVDLLDALRVTVDLIAGRR